MLRNAKTYRSHGAAEDPDAWVLTPRKVEDVPMGAINRLVRDLGSLKGPAAVASRCFSVFKQMGLSTGMLLASGEHPQYFSDTQSLHSAQEEALLRHACQRHAQTGRPDLALFDCNEGVLMTYPATGLLIRDYDTDALPHRPEVLGSLLQSVDLAVGGSLSSGASGPVASPEARRLIEQARTNLDDMRDTLSGCGERMLEVMGLMLHEVQAQLDAFDLPPDNEKLMIELVEDVVEYLVKVYTQSINLDRPLQKTMADLNKLLADSLEADTQISSKRAGA